MPVCACGLRVLSLSLFTEIIIRLARRVSCVVAWLAVSAVCAHASRAAVCVRELSGPACRSGNGACDTSTYNYVGRQQYAGGTVKRVQATGLRQHTHGRVLGQARCPSFAVVPEEKGDGGGSKADVRIASRARNTHDAAVVNDTHKGGAAP